MEATLVSLKEIKPNPYQPRTDEDAAVIEEIAVNIFRNGLLQVPSARRMNGHYELVFGHTRKAAYELLAMRGVPAAEIAPDKRYTQMPLYIHELNDRQMFEMAVAENIKRRDLDPIEQATAMQRYMNEFDATSKQAAELFGVNDATVRGKVRLLDLPEAAQKQLAEGKISESTARSLLSVAKVADEKAIQGILKEIEDPGNEFLPENVIEGTINDLDNVVEMFREVEWRKKEKPRAGDDLWLLDMKNFPNRMLASLSHTDLNALGIADTSKQMTDAVNYLNGRKDVSLPDELKAKIDHLVNPPACNVCPFYMVMDKKHYCGVKVCFERKAEAFRAQKLADMSRSTKIPLYQDSDGAYLTLDEDIASHRKAFEARHADLRLFPKQMFRGYAFQNFKGLDTSIVKLVAVGTSLETLAVKGSKTIGKKSEKEKAEARAMRRFRQVRKELIWEYTAAAQRLFEGLPIDALRKIRNWHYVGIDDRIPDEYRHPDTGTAAEKLEYARRDLVWALIVGETSHYSRDDLMDYLTTFAELTGVKAPKPLVKRAQDWDAEIHELAHVSAETTGKGKKK